MKIVDVQATAYGIPSRRPPSDAPWVWGRLTQVYVQIRTDDGLVGVGESFAYGVPRATQAVVNDTLRPLLVGEDPRQIHGLTETLFQKTHLFGRYGITTFAISGVEMALWGGATRSEVPAYASLVRFPERSEQIRRDAARALDEGYTMLKLHQVTAESVAMAREVIGPDLPLTVDINCEWSPQEAIDMARAMNAHRLLWLEEPVWPPEDFAGLARVQAAAGVPLAAGENACTAHQFREMLDAGAVTFVQPSVTKVGGIGEWLTVAGLARLCGREMAPHSPYFGPGFAATLHLIAHTAQASWIERIYFDLEVEPFVEPLTFANGAYHLPRRPGLGVEVAWEALEPYRL